MKTIGLIGGMSWESTVPYYRQINEAIKARVARAARVNELTQAFDTNISTVLRSVASASTELQATASSMTARVRTSL